MDIKLRGAQSIPLTIAEVDANFSQLRDAVTSSAEIVGGTINGATIGATTAATGRFTNVTITGNLTVDGDTVTLNTSTLDVEDLNITVAKGAANAAAANGAGLTIDGANATILYTSASDSFTINKAVNVSVAPTTGNNLVNKTYIDAELQKYIGLATALGC
jgi:uncharacterized protein YdgA (DUF945 family)